MTQPDEIARLDAEARLSTLVAGVQLGEGRDKGVVYFEYSRKGTKFYTPPKDGKEQFSMIWWSERFHLGPSWRAQVYYADPAPHRAYWESRRMEVREVR